MSHKVQVDVRFTVEATLEFTMPETFSDSDVETKICDKNLFIQYGNDNDAMFGIDPNVLNEQNIRVVTIDCHSDPMGTVTRSNAFNIEIADEDVFEEEYSDSEESSDIDPLYSEDESSDSGENGSWSSYKDISR